MSNFFCLFSLFHSNSFLDLQVPFGEVAAVRDYLKISGEIEKPKEYHELRQIEGLNCRRSEVSGKRLWGLIKDLSKNDPEVFFKHCFVYNYCPLAFLSKTAKNITPAELKVSLIHLKPLLNYSHLLILIYHLGR